MPDVSKIRLPGNTEVVIKDSRITGVDTTPTSGSENVVTSGGVYTAIDENVPKTYAGSPTAGGFANKAVGIPFGEVDATSTSTSLTATVDNFPAQLSDGVCAYVRNNAVSSASGYTLNINGTGALPVYVSNADETRSTTIFSASTTFLFVYNSSRVTGGCWDIYYGYNSNDNTIGYNLRTNKMSLPVTSACYRYRLLFTSADGMHFVPANASTSTNATSTRTTTQTPIDPFGSIRYYSYTTAVTSGSRPGVTYLWEQYELTLGYSFNRTGAALTLTSWKPVYIKCAPQSDGSAIIDADNPYVQVLPTTADGKIYIFLGVATSATTVEMVFHHPVYYHDGTRIRLWTDVQPSEQETFVAIYGVTTYSEITQAINSGKIVLAKRIIEYGENDSVTAFYVGCDLQPSAGRYLFSNAAYSGGYYTVDIITISNIEGEEPDWENWNTNLEECSNKVTTWEDVGDYTYPTTQLVKNALDAKQPLIDAQHKLDYALLSNTPTIPSAPGTLNTTATTAQSTSSSEALSGSITLHKVAKTGTYSDLVGKPTIPSAPGTLVTNATTAQTASAGEAMTGSITLHKVSKTGSYNDLLNKPTIPTDVVKYTSQSLTDAQKAQARANIGAAEQEVFIAIVHVTTYSEITAAVESGKYVIAKDTYENGEEEGEDTETLFYVGFGLRPGEGEYRFTRIVYDSAEDSYTMETTVVFEGEGNDPPQWSGLSYVSMESSMNKEAYSFVSRNNITYPTTKLVYDEIHPAVETTRPVYGGFLPNIEYNLGTITGSVTFTLASAVTGIPNKWYWCFTAGSTAPTITWPSGLLWPQPNAEPPTIDAGDEVEVEVKNGHIVALVFKPTS